MAREYSRLEPQGELLERTDHVTAAGHRDVSRPSVEFYRRRAEIDLLVPIA